MKGTKSTLALSACLLAGSISARAQGTAFTYQGQLQNSGSLANGAYNLSFALFSANSGGTAVAGPVTNTAVVVSSGRCTTTVDFGVGVWDGEANWLQIAVETNGGSGFTTLSPRQPLTPTPYAIAAESVLGPINATNLAPGSISTAQIA